MMTKAIGHETDSVFAWIGTHFATLKRRDPDHNVFVEAMSLGHGAAESRVIASRISDISYLTPHISQLDHPASLPDADKAAERIAAAIMDGEPIGIVTDHDVDGVTSHAIIHTALTRFGVDPGQIRSFIGHRLKHGYGLSIHVAEQVLEAEVPLIITADCGSSDEARIELLNDNGVDVIVGDHHEMPLDGPPKSAYAVVSPARDDSAYPDRTIAGCMVSWLLMCVVRSTLDQAGHLPSPVSLVDLLDFVALGTVADCVTLAESKNNRAVVRAGLSLIEAGKKACWRISRSAFLRNATALSATDLAFSIAPRINARGRLDDAMAGVHFLLSKTDADAASWAELLDAENSARKEIEKGLTECAIEIANEQVSAGTVGLAIWLEVGHPGVHGIVASRIIERFGAPTICLSPHSVNPDEITGSARSAGGVHIKQVFDAIADELGDDILKYGGHAGAGGLTIKASALTAFQSAFDRAVRQQLNRIPGPVIHSDGPCSFAELFSGAPMPARLAKLEPFGRCFDQPLFEFNVVVSRVKAIDKGKSMSLDLVANDGSGTTIRAVWFGASQKIMPINMSNGCEVTVLASPTFNHFRGKTTVELIVRGVVFD